MRPVGRSSMADDEISVIAFFGGKAPRSAPSSRTQKSPVTWGEVTGPRFPVIGGMPDPPREWRRGAGTGNIRSEEHTSELQSLMRISYAVFCLKKKKKKVIHIIIQSTLKYN